MSYGWSSLIIIFTFKLVARAVVRHEFLILCCLVPKKFILVLMLVVMIFSGYDKSVCAMVAFVLGYLQYGCAARSFILLPLGWYKGIDRIIPNFVKLNMGYVTVESVEEALEAECGTGCCKKGEIQDNDGGNRGRNGGDNYDDNDGKDGYNKKVKGDNQMV
jgi:hypothetical protein